MTALSEYPLATLLAAHPGVADFIAGMGLSAPSTPLTLGDWLQQLGDEALFDAGMAREQMLERIASLVAGAAEGDARRVRSLTLMGGRDKHGQPENIALTLRVGEIVCVVGPTGSGKSRLLGDIECLAQGDTPTGRRVWVDGAEPDEALRHALDRKLVAQLSQNMNFVVDLSVREFITLHAECRQVTDPAAMSEQVIACANALAGERFAPDVSLTQLSGGQSRALMIADVALLSASPVVLIDEIENAGVDRQRALDLLVGQDKIVLISTHDPLLALRGHRRVVIRHGGIAEVIDTSARERANLARIAAVDATLAAIRQRLRAGERIEEELTWPR